MTHITTFLESIPFFEKDRLFLSFETSFSEHDFSTVRTEGDFTIATTTEGGWSDERVGVEGSCCCVRVFARSGGFGTGYGVA